MADLEGQQHVLPRSVLLVVSRSRARQLIKKWKRNSTTCQDPLNNHTLPYHAQHAVILFLNPLLLGLLQIEYQTRPISPFSEHPLNLWSFFIATCLYSLGITAINHLKLHHHGLLNSVYGRGMETLFLISTVVSPLSLALIFLHCSAKWVVSILSVVSVVLVARHYLIVVCKLAYSGWERVKHEGNRFLR